MSRRVRLIQHTTRYTELAADRFVPCHVSRERPTHGRLPLRPAVCGQLKGIRQAATQSWATANVCGGVFVREMLDDIETRYKAVLAGRSKLTQASTWS